MLDGEQAASAVACSSIEGGNEVCCMDLGTESGALAGAAFTGTLSLAGVLCDHVNGSTEDCMSQSCS